MDAHCNIKIDNHSILIPVMLNYEIFEAIEVRGKNNLFDAKREITVSCPPHINQKALLSENGKEVAT